MPVLDGLRGVAILLVLVHHLTILGSETRLQLELSRLFELGKHGVDLFFVLSGFLITGILLDSRGEPRYFRNFYARRTLRIFPLYYAVLVFLLLLLPPLLARAPATLAEARRWAAEASNWPWYVAYLSNFHFMVDDAFALPGLDVTWSLAIEEQFYLVWAIAVFFLPPRRMAWLCGVVLVISPVLRLVVGLSGASWTQVYVATPCRMDGLAAGSLLAAVMRMPGHRPERLLRAAGWVATAAAAGLILLFPGGFLTGIQGVGMVVGLTLAILFFAGSLPLLLYAPPGNPVAAVFRSRFLGFFGKYSYGLYLLHIPVRDGLKRSLFAGAGLGDLHGWSAYGWQLLYFMAGIGATVAVAWLSWQLYEKQWLRLKRYFPR